MNDDIVCLMNEYPFFSQIAKSRDIMFESDIEMPSVARELATMEFIFFTKDLKSMVSISTFEIEFSVEIMELVKI